MTWFRNIFADTLSSNNGALTVVDLGASNRITFREVPNAIEYTLFVRPIGTSQWIQVDQQDGTGTLSPFVDAFAWSSERDPIDIEYKVTVTKSIPVIADGYYTTGVSGKDDQTTDPDPANRTPGMYEKVSYFTGGDIDVNEELSSRSDWSIENSSGKYDATFSTTFDAITVFNGTTINWRDTDSSSIIALNDADFTQHLFLLRENWVNYMADNIRTKVADGKLVMSEIDSYCSDPEIKQADRAFEFGLAIAALYQHGSDSNLYTPNDPDQLDTNPYFDFDISTGRATATSKANIFASVWCEGMYFRLLQEEFQDLELEGKFVHYNLPYRFPSSSLNAFNSSETLGELNRTQRTQFLLNVFKTMAGDGINEIIGLEHEILQSVYNLCGTFVDFYPPHFADEIDSWMALIDAIEAFGTPGKNTIMASGQFNTSYDLFNVACEDWKSEPDLVSKPYYNESDFSLITTPPEQGVVSTIPLCVWLYIQEYITNNTNINLQRFYQFGIDSAIFNYSGSDNDINRINALSSVVDGFGTPYSTPPTESDKQNYAEYRAYGQYNKNKDYTNIPRGGGTEQFFTPDRRPLYAEAYGAARSERGDRERWGVASIGYRRTPLAGSPEADFNNVQKNGRLLWVRNQTRDLIPLGYKRYSFTNIQGWTTYDAGGGNSPAVFQPHFPSNPFSGLELTEAKVYLNQLGTDFHISPTPFTNNGSNGFSDPNSIPAGTPGDNKASWTAAISFLRNELAANSVPLQDQQVVAYTGYRPTYTDKSMTQVDRSLLGVSKQSNRGSGGDRWSGEGDSPAYTPDVGFDGERPGYSYSVEGFDDWWGLEVAGCKTLGFDSIGLDTGTLMYMNSGGMYNTGVGDKEVGIRQGNTDLHNLFKENYGVRTFTEAVALNYGINPKDPVPWTSADQNNDQSYTAGAMWAYFGSWWGYVGADNNLDTYGTSGTNGIIGEPVGGKVWFNDGNQQIGEFGSSFNPATSEVHCVFQWNDGITSYATAKVIRQRGWTVMKQIMYDYHQAGIVVSVGGRFFMESGGYLDGTTNQRVTSDMFFGFVQDLSNNLITERPRPHTLRDRIGAGTNQAAFVPDEILNGDPHSMFFLSDWAAEATCRNLPVCDDEDLAIYANKTDQEIFDRFRNTTLNSIDGRHNVVRNTYLNAASTGYVQLDIEHPLNFGFLMDPPRLEDTSFDPITEPDFAAKLTTFCEGLVRRIQIFKQHCPNINIGIWRFSDAQRAAIPGEQERSLDIQKFCSQVEWNGQSLYDAVDYLCPTLYHRNDRESSVHTRTVDGVRTDMVKEACDALFELHGEVKPVIPIIAFEYEGGPHVNESAVELNAIEVNNLRDYADNFIVWHALSGELDLFEGKLDTLMNEIELVEQG